MYILSGICSAFEIEVSLIATRELNSNCSNSIIVVIERSYQPINVRCTGNGKEIKLIVASFPLDTILFPFSSLRFD